MGTRPGRPREFDNRYYLDDSLLPGPDLLRRAGIERVVCVVARPGGSLVVDLQSYLADLRTKGLKIFAASFEDPETTLTAIQPTRPRKSRRWAGFRRSGAGGFGRLVPEPSSSGS